MFLIGKSHKEKEAKLEATFKWDYTIDNISLAPLERTTNILEASIATAYKEFHSKMHEDVMVLKEENNLLSF